MFYRSLLSFVSIVALGVWPLAYGSAASALEALPPADRVALEADRSAPAAPLPSSPPSPAPDLAADSPRSAFDPEAVLADLTQAQVVYLGEVHDRQADHDGQLEIIRALWADNPKLAIGMEMFQRPFQGAIDRYLGGELDETELQAQTDYAQRWGFDWELYAPFLRFAQTQNLPVLALNTPTELTRKVAQQGLASLTEADQRYVPAPEDIDMSNPDYRAFLAGVFYSHAHGHAQPDPGSTSGDPGADPGTDPGQETGFDRFVAAQVLWDETMAAAIADFLQANPDYRVVVLTGQGHVIYGYGIPNRVQRRLGADLVQRTVLINPGEGLESGGPGAIAD
ncbi:MAG: ChaN family lipoprotein, partial [Prochlorothrix sp.]